MFSKFKRKFSRHKKIQIGKGRENLQQILVKFYLRLDKVVNKIY